ncbi:hypothetical protein RIF29_13886 [Crotalaria pallida]|uniref:Uncharacterized protein n=1 Tax=Crotalaria pallida TaxID=3830 RepID=A0AAN9IHQ6_CROPI
MGSGRCPRCLSLLNPISLPPLLIVSGASAAFGGMLQLLFDISNAITSFPVLAFFVLLIFIQSAMLKQFSFRIGF